MESVAADDNEDATRNLIVTNLRAAAPADRPSIWHVSPAGRATSPASDTPRSIAAQVRGFAELADRLASLGPAAVAEELSRFIEHARGRGATPLLLSILGDVGEPDVVRARAFGRIVAELEALGRTRRRGARLSGAAREWETTRITDNGDPT
jgi:hypothetical protein